VQELPIPQVLAASEQRDGMSFKTSVLKDAIGKSSAPLYTLRDTNMYRIAWLRHSSNTSSAGAALRDGLQSVASFVICGSRLVACSF